MKYDKAVRLSAVALHNYKKYDIGTIEEIIQTLENREKGIEVIWDDEDIYCGNCDNYVYEDENYCKECGAKLLIHGRDIP